MHVFRWTHDKIPERKKGKSTHTNIYTNSSFALFLPGSVSVATRKDSIRLDRGFPCLVVSKDESRGRPTNTQEPHTHIPSALHLRGHRRHLELVHDCVHLLVQKVEGGDGGFRHSGLGTISPHALPHLELLYDVIDLFRLAPAPGALDFAVAGHQGGGRKTVETTAAPGVDGPEFSVGPSFLGLARPEAAGLDELGVLLA